MERHLGCRDPLAPRGLPHEGPQTPDDRAARRHPALRHLENPWTPGMAEILWVDWYPVTFSRGYIGTASTHFPKVRAYVNRVTPGTPIWLSTQGHEYKPGDRRRPSASELERQVRDGLSYLKADGIVFYTYHNPLYGLDLERNGSLWSTARSIVSRQRAGTFMPRDQRPDGERLLAPVGRRPLRDRRRRQQGDLPEPGAVAYLATGLPLPRRPRRRRRRGAGGGPILLTDDRRRCRPGRDAELLRLSPPGSSSSAARVRSRPPSSRPSDALPPGPSRASPAPTAIATAAAVSKATFPRRAVVYLASASASPTPSPAPSPRHGAGARSCSPTAPAPGPGHDRRARPAQPARIVVLGGTGVLSAAVVTAVDAPTRPGPSRAWRAPDRYATAAAVSTATFAPRCAGRLPRTRPTASPTRSPAPSPRPGPAARCCSPRPARWPGHRSPSSSGSAGPDRRPRRLGCGVVRRGPRGHGRHLRSPGSSGVPLAPAP